MTFKSGSGDLGLDGGDEGSETETETETTEDQPTEEEVPASAEGENPQNNPSPDASAKEYPYFVRRNNVGDERDTRLEVHVRDKVADKEADFRNELADHLETSEISKTDAREFALLTAFQHPDRVAELMQKEGFGTFR